MSAWSAERGDPMPTIAIDGRVVDAASATISVLDRGLLYGDGLFEVLRTWNGRAVELEAHLDRLEDSARFLRLPIDRGAVTSSVQLAIDSAASTWRQAAASSHEAAASRRDWRIRIVITRGPGALAVPMASAGPGHTIVIVEPIVESIVEPIVESIVEPKGELGDSVETMSLAVVDWPLPRRAGRGHKTLAYLDHVIARELAREKGADDAVRLDGDGHVAEGGTCNLFAVRGGVVHAIDRDDADEPRGGILPGVTAARVRTICRDADIPVRSGPLTIDELLAADEVFVTSAVRGVVAVTRIVSDDERTLPIGAVTRRIRAAHVGEMTRL